LEVLLQELISISGFDQGAEMGICMEVEDFSERALSTSKLSYIGRVTFRYTYTGIDEATELTGLAQGMGINTGEDKGWDNRPWVVSEGRLYYSSKAHIPDAYLNPVQLNGDSW
jgi:hypothetical protein